MIIAFFKFFVLGINYEFYSGCEQGEEHEDGSCLGWICGQYPKDPTWRPYSFDKCLQYAKHQSSFAFSYRGALSLSKEHRGCLLCNETQIRNKEIHPLFGVYVKGQYIHRHSHIIL